MELETIELKDRGLIRVGVELGAVYIEQVEYSGAKTRLYLSPVETARLIRLLVIPFEDFQRTISGDLLP